MNRFAMRQVLDGAAEVSAIQCHVGQIRVVRRWAGCLLITLLATPFWAGGAARAADPPAEDAVTADGVPPGKSAAENVAVATSLRKLGAIVKADGEGWIREVSFAQSKTSENITVLLVGLTKLEVLDLSEKSVGDEDLKHFAALTSVEILVLSGTKITDAGLVHLQGLESLAGLDLRNTAVSGKGLAQLKELKELGDLVLDRTMLVDENLPELAALSSLQTVSISGTKITPQGIAKLKRSAPKLLVTR